MTGEAAQHRSTSVFPTTTSSSERSLSACLHAVIHTKYKYFKPPSTLPVVCKCFFVPNRPQACFPLLLFSNMHGKWLVLHTKHRTVSYSADKKKNCYPGHVGRFASTSAEMDRRGCQNELFVTTMKIPVIAHRICVPPFSPRTAEMIPSALSKQVLFDNHTAYLALGHSHFFLHSSVNGAQGS